MEAIASFLIDHEKLLRGIYLSRKDKIGNEVISSFDIRLKEPNREPVVDMPALHTIEHLGATFLRNHEKWADKTIYFGPMGCRTGCYLVLGGDLESKDVLPLVKELFQFIENFQGDIPGATPEGCGNYSDQNLNMAHWEAGKFRKEVLEDISDKNLVYP